jgi:hypothetical protein
MSYFDSKLHKTIDKYGLAYKAYSSIAGLGAGTALAGFVLFGVSTTTGKVLIVVGMAVSALVIAMYVQSLRKRSIR